MYIKKLCACLLSLLLTLTLLAPCAAFAEKAEEAEEKTVRVGWYESTFCYHDAFGRRCGIVYEYQQRIAACKLICSSFLHSQVYRIGGDEFAIVLEGEDYAAQDKLLRDFESLVSKNLTRGEIVVASGSARFHPGKDQNLQDVFERADERMYRRKRELKEQAEKR